MAADVSKPGDTPSATRSIGWHRSGIIRASRCSPTWPRSAVLTAKSNATARLSRQTRYYLCSARLDAKTFARAVRAHWGVENRLHWVLDVVFREDLARLRTRHGPQNMAIIRHSALNLLSQAKPITSLKNRRKRAGWNTAYLANILRQTA